VVNMAGAYHSVVTRPEANIGLLLVAMQPLS